MQLPRLRVPILRKRRHFVAVETAPPLPDAAAAARLEEQYVAGELSLAEYEAALERLVRPPRVTRGSVEGAGTGSALRLRPIDDPPAPAARRALLGAFVLALGVIGGAALLAAPGTRSALAPFLAAPPAGQRPPAPPPQPPTRTILLRDDFTDPRRGVLPTASFDPENVVFSYDSDGYAVRIINPAWDRAASAHVLGQYRDAAITVDARLVGETPGRTVYVGCRYDPSRPGTYYRFVVDPARGTFRLSRWQDNRETLLVGPQPAPAIRREDAPNRLELSCVGASIAARVNGVQVAAVQDGSLASGRLLLGAGAYAGSPLGLEARFNDLVITQP